MSGADYIIENYRKKLETMRELTRTVLNIRARPTGDADSEGTAAEQNNGEYFERVNEKISYLFSEVGAYDRVLASLPKPTGDAQYDELVREERSVTDALIEAYAAAEEFIGRERDILSDQIRKIRQGRKSGLDSSPRSFEEKIE